MKPVLIHHPDLSIPMPEGHRFPMSKFALLREILIERGLVTADGFYRPAKPDAQMLALVHDPDYIKAFSTGKLDQKAQKRIGLPCGPDLTHRSFLAVGTTILTCQLALEHGLALSTAGGTHHAHRDFGAGFCIFNDMAVAAALMLKTQPIKKVLILDLDVHQGDGTAAIFQDDPRVFTFSVHGEKQFPLRKMTSDWDIPIPDGTDDQSYLAMLEQSLPELLNRARPDFIIYDAGVDPHENDRLGRMKLTDQGIHLRDKMVLDWAKKHGIPLAGVIGGGYDHDHRKVAERHAILHLTAYGWL